MDACRPSTAFPCLTLHILFAVQVGGSGSKRGRDTGGPQVPASNKMSRPEAGPPSRRSSRAAVLSRTPAASQVHCGNLLCGHRLVSLQPDMMCMLLLIVFHFSLQLDTADTRVMSSQDRVTDFG